MPSGCVHADNPSSLPGDLTSEARASAPRPRPPRRVSRQASRAGECWLAPILCAGISPLCPPHPCGCALLRGSEASPLRLPPSPPVMGLPSVWKLLLLHSSFPEQIPSLFFCLCCFFFLLPYPGTWGVSCLLGSLRSLPAFSRRSVGVVPHVDVFLMYLWGERYLHDLLFRHLEGHLLLNYF